VVHFFLRNSVPPFSRMSELVLAFNSTLDGVLSGATATERRGVQASVYRELCPDDWGDSLQVCTCLNNASFRWLERTRDSGRITALQAELRAHMLNAFFLVNFPD
jgi:hypothetical protein